MADNWRKKNKAQDAFSSLYNPEKQMQQKEKTKALKKLLDQREEKEMTFKPVTNKKINDIVYADEAGIDRGHHLYKQSKVKEKGNVETEEYYYQKEKSECKFKPKTNKEIYYDQNPKALASVKQIKGMEKIMERMKKAREEAEFKKRMTERSNFSATVGVKKVKKLITTGKIAKAPVASFTNSTSAKNSKIGG